MKTLKKFYQPENFDEEPVHYCLKKAVKNTGQILFKFEWSTMDLKYYSNVSTQFKHSKSHSKISSILKKTLSQKYIPESL